MTSSYILVYDRVLENSFPLIQEGLADKFILSIIDVSQNNAIVEQLSIHMTINKLYPENIQEISRLEEDFRSFLIKLSTVPFQSKKDKQEYTWNIMVTTKPTAGPHQEALLEVHLTSGEWYVENEFQPEQLAKVKYETTNVRAKITPVKSLSPTSLQLEALIFDFT